MKSSDSEVVVAMIPGFFAHPEVFFCTISDMQLPGNLFCVIITLPIDEQFNAPPVQALFCVIVSSRLILHYERTSAMNQSRDDFFERTLREYEFTVRAQKKINQIVTSESFQDMPAEDTLRFLLSELDQVPFCDYLKRYLYRQTGMTENFRSIPDATWENVIDLSFSEHNAPHSFEPTTTRWHAMIRSWLRADRVRRDTVFLLGFGLCMSAEDVSDMLTKGLNEDDFHPGNPREALFRYCYTHDLPYSYAWSVMTRDNKSAPSNVPVDEIAVPENEEQLLALLRRLDEKGVQAAASRERYNVFMSLYDRCREMIAEIYQQDEAEKPEKERRIWRKEDISPADLEQMLCSGVPYTDSGNLIKSSHSLLDKRFESFRPSRQHLDSVIRQKLEPDRYDLITLSFFLRSLDEGDDFRRFQQFVADTNRMLSGCGMRNLYPVHPYEAFILVCMVSPCPLAHYADVIEMSYTP